MLKKRLKGDTLIEVLFAAGIFSMVAISVVALMNGSTSKIQSALESTMTRNEIDSEAEALRFIQSAYVSELSTNKNDLTLVYRKLWNKIKSLAITDESTANSVIDFSPSTCSELYQSDGEAKRFGFVINYRQLDNINQNTDGAPVLYLGSSSALLKEAVLYPRLMFNGQDEMYKNEAGIPVAATNLTAAEGIYVVAVKDIAKTNVITPDSSYNTNKAAFYDFYIRSCWQAPGSDVPTVVSTVIRLYDPDEIR